MKRIFSVLLSAFLCIVFAGCDNAEAPSIDHSAYHVFSAGDTEISNSDSASKNVSDDTVSESITSEVTISEDTMYIIIGEHTLSVKMADNSSAEALIELLKDGDITVEAHDYGNFEKVGPLGVKLPTNDEQITTKSGDVILYQGDKITVYYDTNSWSFTLLGRVQDVTDSELKSILGDGDVTMVLSLNASSDKD